MLDRRGRSVQSWTARAAAGETFALRVDLVTFLVSILTFVRLADPHPARRDGSGGGLACSTDR